MLYAGLTLIIYPSDALVGVLVLPAHPGEESDCSLAEADNLDSAAVAGRGGLALVASALAAAHLVHPRAAVAGGAAVREA